MADLTDIQSAESVKIIGADSSGVETNPVDATVNGLKVDGSAVTQPVSAASLPLPAGASTSALQTTGNTSVASIDTKTPTLGQKNMAGSTPVVIASDQSTINTQDAADGPVTPGTVASKSELIGGQYNTALPTLTSGQQVAVQLDSSGRLLLSPSITISTISGNTDKSAFVYGVNVEQPIGGVYQDLLPTVTAGTTAAARITQSRGLHTNLRNDAGTEIGTSSNPIRQDPTGTTSQPVTDGGGSLTVDTPQLPSTIGQKTSSASTSVVLASDQVLSVIASDVITVSSVSGAIGVGGSAVEAKVGVSALSGRKMLIITAMEKTIYFGSTNAVTIATGTPIVKNQTVTFMFSDAVPVWLISSAPNGDVRIMEAK